MVDYNIFFIFIFSFLSFSSQNRIQTLNNLTVPASSHVALQCKVENPIESYDEGTLTVSLEFRLVFKKFFR